jgi:hypothetical protein
MQLVLSVTLVRVQAPAVQLSVLQSFPSSQFAQAAPAAPHLAKLVPI